MTNFCKVVVLVLLCVLGTTQSTAGERRDARSDVVKIATKYLESYSRVQHKAGDTDGVFIEDVVIPSVVDAVASYKGKVPPAVRNDVYRFLIAGKSMASEELAGLAGQMYRASPTEFCGDVSKQSQSSKSFLLQQAADGLALNDPQHGKLSCP